MKSETGSEPDEFVGQLGHISGALNMPLGEIRDQMSEIDRLRDRPIVLVCRTDKRSASAASTLRSAGFRDVHVLRGGMEQWNRSGNPVEGMGHDEAHSIDARPASKTG